jgi:hypothetical protein
MLFYTGGHATCSPLPGQRLTIEILERKLLSNNGAQAFQVKNDDEKLDKPVFGIWITISVFLCRLRRFLCDASATT